MSSQQRLSAFKILKDVVRISLVKSDDSDRFPAKFCHLMASEEINLLFLTCGKKDSGWGVNIAVEFSCAEKAIEIIEENFPNITYRSTNSGILSLFPHRRDPSIAGSLFHVLDITGIEPEALAYSNSAISVVLHEEAIDTTTSALFEPFQFSAYRTPADWKLAQKGKEELYKDVVASYQEKRPKVYSLEWLTEQNLFTFELSNYDLSPMGNTLIDFSIQGLQLPFLTSTPTTEKQGLNLFLCLPVHDSQIYPEVKNSLPSESVPSRNAPVAVFSMNGPHFGDRYGIASELLTAINSAGVQLLALGCAIASINGVVPAEQIEATTDVIKQCFDVPSVIMKT
jgi:aspartokinase